MKKEKDRQARDKHGHGLYVSSKDRGMTISLLPHRGFVHLFTLILQVIALAM